MTPLRALARRIAARRVRERVPSFGLAATSVAFLFTYPSMTDTRASPLVALGLLVALFAFGVVSLAQGSRQIVAGGLLALPVSGFLLWERLLYEPSRTSAEVQILGAVLFAPFALFVATIALGRASSERHGLDDRLVAAAAAYLLIGLGWTGAYAVGLWLDPGALSGVDRQSPAVWAELLYFSFVTMTTLGYGDITPVSHRMQALTVLESVTGVFFLAFLVSRIMTAASPRSSR